jgi:uroporphyrinogen-III synthase
VISTTSRGPRVLLTRPQHQAGPLQDAVRQAGGDVIAFPVMDIVARDAADIDRELGARAVADIVVFVSPNAVQHGSAAARDAKHLAAIGAATAAALQQAGYSADIVPVAGFDSEALLQEAALQQVNGKTVLIVRGDGGRELLAQTLGARGAQVEYLSVYERRRHQPSAAALHELQATWRQHGMDYVIAMSVASLEFMLELLPSTCRHALPASALVTPSARVLKTAQERIPGMRALLSESPATGDLLAAMLADRQAQTDDKND